MRRSTPLLNDDEKLRGLGADIERIEPGGRRATDIPPVQQLEA